MTMGYTLEMRDDSGEENDYEFDHLPDPAEIVSECEDWVSGGEWGSDGAAVDVYWDLIDADGEVFDSGCQTVMVAPDHDALIKAAGGDTSCDHDWSAEGQGGCSENPGVWSTGGTSMVFRSHCTHCGLVRIERSTGSQRNPGEHDTFEYQMPDDNDNDNDNDNDA